MISIKAKVIGGEILPSVILFPYLPEETVEDAINKIMYLMQLIDPDVQFKHYSDNAMMCKLNKTIIKFEFTRKNNSLLPLNSENVTFKLQQ